MKSNNKKSVLSFKSILKSIKLYSIVYAASAALLLGILLIAKMEGVGLDLSNVVAYIFSPLVIITNTIIFFIVKTIINGRDYEYRKTI